MAFDVFDAFDGPLSFLVGLASNKVKINATKYPQINIPHKKNDIKMMI